MLVAAAEKQVLNPAEESEKPFLLLQNGEIKDNGDLNMNGAQHNMRDIAGEETEPLNRVSAENINEPANT